MKIISFIKERPVILKILEHLNMWDDPQQERPTPKGCPIQPRQNPCPPPTPQELIDDDWPGNEEPYITYDF